MTADVLLCGGARWGGDRVDFPGSPGPVGHRGRAQPADAINAVLRFPAVEAAPAGCSLATKSRRPANRRAAGADLLPVDPAAGG